MTIMERIELNPKVCNGKPVIKGTRIPISVILEQIAQGESWDDLLRGYPELKKDDIKAALLYVRTSLDHTERNRWVASSLLTESNCEFRDSSQL